VSAQSIAAPSVQPPLLQDAVIHGSALSQVAPGGASISMHWPETGLQVETLHGFVGTMS